MPVAVSLLFLFIVTLSILFVRTCRNHNNLPLRRHGGLLARRLLQSRKLSFSDLSDRPTGADEITYRRLPTSFQLDVNATRVGQYTETANSSPGFAFPPISSDDPAGRRLSEKSPDTGDKSRSSEQKSHGVNVGSPLAELCVEASTGGESAFSALLDLEQREKDVESGEHAEKSRVDEHVVKAPPESERPTDDDANDEAIYAGLFAPLDVSLKDLMDPDTLPSTLLTDTGMLPGSVADESATFSGTLAQLVSVSPLPRFSEEGIRAASFPSRESSSFLDVARVQYGHLLSLWNTHTLSIISEPLYTSPTHGTVERIILLEANAKASESKDVVWFSSTDSIGYQLMPASTSVRIAATREQPTSTEGFPGFQRSSLKSPMDLFESPAQKQQSAPQELITAPWDLQTVTFGCSRRGQYAMHRVRKLRALLSNRRLTPHEKLEALILGKQILTEIYPFQIEDMRTSRRFRTLASQFVHMVVRLDTLLWLADVFPQVTCPAAWWGKLVDFSNIRDSFSVNLSFSSKLKILIVGSIECLRLLAEQKRPVPGAIDRLMSMFEKNVSRAKRPIYSASKEAELASEAGPEPSGSIQRVVGSQLAPEGELLTLQEYGLREVSTNVEAEPSEAGILVHSSHGVEQGTHASHAEEEKVGTVSQPGGSDGTETVAAGYGSTGASQRHKWFLISSLSNVPQVMNRDVVEATLLESYLWDINTADIGVSFNRRLSIVHPSEASAILGQDTLSLEDSVNLLLLGKRIVAGLRVIEHWRPFDFKWTNLERIRALSLLVIQLDTLVRISQIFPRVTRAHLWWRKMVEKCNLEILLKPSIDKASVHFEALQTTKNALKTLLQQTRPDAAVVAYVYTYYQTVLTRPKPQAKHEKA